MKTSPAARSWIAAGVRHELLTRALPALRHHMAAPVSVVRMGLLLLKRQVAAPQPDAAACAQRIAAVDQQVSVVVEGIRSLSDWELSMPGEGITRSQLVAQCAGLLRTPFELADIALEIDPALQQPAAGDEPSHPAGPALRYLLLGALSHLHDGVPGVRAIRIEAEGADALRISATARGQDEAAAPADAQRAPRSLAIDAVALLSLAEDLGYCVAIERDAVRFALAR